MKLNMCSSLLADGKYIEKFCRQFASIDRGGASGNSIEWKPRYQHEGTMFTQYCVFVNCCFWILRKIPQMEVDILL